MTSSSAGNHLRSAIGWHPDLKRRRADEHTSLLRQRTILASASRSTGEKDRGKEPQRDQGGVSTWFWGWGNEPKGTTFAGIGKEADSNRWNDWPLIPMVSRKARGARGEVIDHERPLR
jgi:hypothetical protein